MPAANLFRVLLALAALGVGAIVVHAEFFSNATIVSSKKTVVVSPNTTWLEQQKRAEQKDLQRGITSACAALHQMGQTDKNCPSQ